MTIEHSKQNYGQLIALFSGESLKPKDGSSPIFLPHNIEIGNSRFTMHTIPDGETFDLTDAGLQDRNEYVVVTRRPHLARETLWRLYGFHFSTKPDIAQKVPDRDFRQTTMVNLQPPDIAEAADRDEIKTLVESAPISIRWTRIKGGKQTLSWTLKTGCELVAESFLAEENTASPQKPLTLSLGNFEAIYFCED